jgi:hypothetical protein
MDSQGEDEAAKIELTYSIPRGINRAKPTLRTLVVCIIQVIRSVQSRASDWRLLPLLGWIWTSSFFIASVLFMVVVAVLAL